MIGDAGTAWARGEPTTPSMWRNLKNDRSADAGSVLQARCDAVAPVQKALTAAAPITDCHLPPPDTRRGIVWPLSGAETPRNG